MTYRPFIATVLALAASRAAAFPHGGGAAPAAPAPAQPAAGLVTSKPGASDAAAGVRLRLVDGRTLALTDDRAVDVALASVDGRPVTLGEVREAAASSHSDRAQSHTGKVDFSVLLERLVRVRLVEAEARAMGLNELDEVKEAVAQNRDAIRLDLVRRRAVGKVTPDRKEVERRYAEAAKEWSLQSVLFAAQPDAMAFGAAVEGGGDFGKLAAKAVADKKALGSGAQPWVRTSALLPEVAKAIGKLAPGRTTAPIQVKDGWTVVRLEGTRTGKDAELRQKISAAVASAAMAKKLEAYYARLKKERAKIDEKLLKSVNFDTVQPFDTLRKDQRVVARIAGDAKPITIGDVAEEVARPLFHGIDSAQKEKRIDKEKANALDALVSRRLVRIESARQGIDNLPEAKRRVAEFETNILFSTFIEKVVVPEVQVTDEALRAAYAKKKAELTYPAFYALDGLAFADAKKAQAAATSLQGGTDFKWLKGNAEGVVAPAPSAPVLDGSTISARQMPEDLRKALTGAKEGDARLYDAAGQHFVVVVRSFTPERTQSFEEAASSLKNDVVAELLSARLDDWAAKLRTSHDVKVFLASGK